MCGDGTGGGRSAQLHGHPFFHLFLLGVAHLISGAIWLSFGNILSLRLVEETLPPSDHRGPVGHILLVKIVEVCQGA